MDSVRAKKDAEEQREARVQGRGLRLQCHFPHGHIKELLLDVNGNILVSGNLRGHLNELLARLLSAETSIPYRLFEILKVLGNPARLRGDCLQERAVLRERIPVYPPRPPPPPHDSPRRSKRHGG